MVRTSICLKINADFRKGLVNIEDSKSERLITKFYDGTTAETDAVIGCDGINLWTQNIIVGENAPTVMCVNAKKYPYRGMIPMLDYMKPLAEKYPVNATLWVNLSIQKFKVSLA